MSVVVSCLTAEHEFPREGTWEEQARFCLRYALLAPSNHNAQPWLFRVVDGAVELRADRSRGLAVSDPFDRELSISCGAALFNLRTALQRFGFQVEVEVVPAADDPDLLARVVPVGHVLPSPETRLLFQAIPRRHTNRGSFDTRPVSPRLLSEFAGVVRREGAWVEFLEGEKKFAAADLIAQGDRAQLADPHFRRELYAWQSRSRGARLDGLPEFGNRTSDSVSGVGPLLVRTFDFVGLGRAAEERELALGSPVLAVLGTRHEEASAWLTAGQALQHLLLAATVAGVHASFLNQAIEVSPLRRRLCALTGCSGFPQIVLRMGYAAPAGPTPRRNLEDVLLR